MLIRTPQASADIYLQARVPTTDGPTATLEGLSFKLLADDSFFQLNLDTGEVFQKDFDEKRHIAAGLTIRPSPDDSYYKESDMHYAGGREDDGSGFPSEIYFMVFIEPTAFRELADNIKVGFLQKR